MLGRTPFGRILNTAGACGNAIGRPPEFRQYFKTSNRTWGNITHGHAWWSLSRVPGVSWGWSPGGLLVVAVVAVVMLVVIISIVVVVVAVVLEGRQNGN